MSTVVITGARRYIGSALVEKLAGEGHTLRLVSRAPAISSAETNAKMVYVQADLRDETSWDTLLESAQAIVHLRRVPICERRRSIRRAIAISMLSPFKR